MATLAHRLRPDQETWRPRNPPPRRDRQRQI